MNQIRRCDSFPALDYSLCPARKWCSLLHACKLQNRGPVNFISLNHKSAYCVILRSSKDFDTGGSKWALPIL